MSFVRPPFANRWHAAAVIAAFASSFALAAPAMARVSNVYFSVSTYPSDFIWDGVGVAPVAGNLGSYEAVYNVRGDDAVPPYHAEHLRGGGLLRDDVGPVAVLPGDVIRLVDDKRTNVLAQSTFTGQPAMTASATGQAAFAGTVTRDATSVTVTLLRRIRRTENSTDYVTGQTTATTTNAFDDVSYGRLTSLSDTTFEGTFTTPILAGDYVTVTQSLAHIDGDVRTSEKFSVTTPVGLVPAATIALTDTLAPKLNSVLLGARSLRISQFLKNGLNTFATPDEPATITQTLTARPKQRKGKKPAQPVLVAQASGATNAPGATAPLTLTALKPGRKYVKRFSRTGVKLTLTTTVSDSAGNRASSAQVVKLRAG